MNDRVKIQSKRTASQASCHIEVAEWRTGPYDGEAALLASTSRVPRILNDEGLPVRDETSDIPMVVELSTEVEFETELDAVFGFSSPFAVGTCLVSDFEHMPIFGRETTE